MKKVSLALFTAIMSISMTLPVQCREFVPPPVIPVYSRSFDQITYEDFELVAQAVMAEAGGEDFVGQYEVAEVIFNRVESDQFPDPIEGVLSQEGQFSTWTSGLIQSAVPHDSAYEAVQQAIEKKTLPSDVLYFSAGGYFSWADPYQKIGNQYFCRGKEAASK